MIKSTPNPFHFDSEKAVEAILYIAQRTPIPDRFHICKILYFADKYHLENYARFILGDYYVAMKNGPVPSGAYDLIKAADNGEIPEIIVDDREIIPGREAKMEYFSDSDIEAIDWSITEYGNIPFARLSEISHDQAWKATTRDGALLETPYTMRSIPMPLEEIVASLPDHENLLEFLYEFN